MTWRNIFSLNIVRGFLIKAVLNMQSRMVLAGAGSEFAALRKAVANL